MVKLSRINQILYCVIGLCLALIRLQRLMLREKETPASATRAVLMANRNIPSYAALRPEWFDVEEIPIANVSGQVWEFPLGTKFPGETPFYPRYPIVIGQPVLSKGMRLGRPAYSPKSQMRHICSIRTAEGTAPSRGEIVEFCMLDLESPKDRELTFSPKVLFHLEVYDARAASGCDEVLVAVTADVHERILLATEITHSFVRPLEPYPQIVEMAKHHALASSCSNASDHETRKLLGTTANNAEAPHLHSHNRHPPRLQLPEFCNIRVADGSLTKATERERIELSWISR